LVQPDDGVTALIEAIDAAKKSVEILIFRFDRHDIEAALGRAVVRGVKVHALTAYTNRGGEKTLRALELRLLDAGATVDRTAGDLLRYHGKMMIIDRRQLHVLAFNYTQIDIQRSRSFGVITTNRKLVQEAIRLFEADCARQPYTAGNPGFLVSPINARKELSAFIRGAKKELLIYDPEVSDKGMIELLQARAKAGVEIRIFGKVGAKGVKLNARPLPRIRLHARTIVRDRSQVFLGSQSLRALELDSRREVGVMVRDRSAVDRIAKTFDEDWAMKADLPAEAEDSRIGEPAVVPANKVAKRVAKAVVENMQPIAPEVVAELGPHVPEVEAAVKTAVKDAVKEVVRDFVENAMEHLEAEVN
jgi:phosphatidylserine/phosphatidylglycerophosphate/cardiolipin synthase-like enzyme